MRLRSCDGASGGINALVGWCVSQIRLVGASRRHHSLDDLLSSRGWDFSFPPPLESPRLRRAARDCRPVACVEAKGPRLRCRGRRVRDAGALIVIGERVGARILDRVDKEFVRRTVVALEVSSEPRSVACGHPRPLRADHLAVTERGASGGRVDVEVAIRRVRTRVEPAVQQRRSVGVDSLRGIACEKGK